jgi:phenylpyruvate tautomerase PptA (4-oxalocrotonate tautomerase family)
MEVRKMPVIKYEGPPLQPDQRKALIEGFTDVVCRVIPNIPKEAYYVFLHEYPDEKVGVGGCPLPDYIAKMRNENETHK